MKSSLSIDKTKFKGIIWPLVALYVSRLFFDDIDEAYLFIYIALIIIVIGFARKIFIPNIVGIYPYMALILIMAIIGLVMYKTRYVARDLFYLLPAVILVILGYYLFCAYQAKSIVQTIVLCGFISSMYSFGVFLTSAGGISELQDLRDIFNIEIYEICLIFLLLVVYIFNQEKCVFGKKTDVLLLVIFLMHIILSMSRSAWVEVIVGVPIIIIANLFYNSRRASTYAKTFIIIALAIVGVFALYAYAPSNIIDDYNTKVENTSDELNQDQYFNSVEDAMGNWRAYENKSAISQWETSTSLVQLFGAGLGKGIYIKFVPYAWTNLDKEHTIPLLHNAYYTMLAKGGVVGVILLVFFLVYPIFVAINSLRKKGFSSDAIALITIGVAFVIQAYVVRGPISQHPNITWGILVGWLCGQLKREDS